MGDGVSQSFQQVYPQHAEYEVCKDKVLIWEELDALGVTPLYLVEISYHKFFVHHWDEAVCFSDP